MPFNPNDPEFQKSARLGSLYANRAYVTIENGVARLTFGEAPAGSAETVYSAAVSMTALDAVALADAIYRTFDEAYPPRPPPQPPRTPDPLSGIAGMTPPKTRLGG